MAGVYAEIQQKPSCTFHVVPAGQSSSFEGSNGNMTAVNCIT